MFTAKQTRLMNTLGVVGDRDRCSLYDAYCEVSCEMRAEGMNAGSFTDYLERKVALAEYVARRKNAKALQGA